MRPTTEPPRWALAVRFGLPTRSSAANRRRPSTRYYRTSQRPRVDSARAVLECVINIHRTPQWSRPMEHTPVPRPLPDLEGHRLASRGTCSARSRPSRTSTTATSSHGELIDEGQRGAREAHGRPGVGDARRQRLPVPQRRRPSATSTSSRRRGPLELRAARRRLRCSSCSRFPRPRTRTRAPSAPTCSPRRPCGDFDALIALDDEDDED